MARKGDPCGQNWGTFLHNHMPVCTENLVRLIG
jgi:hypothetical protein